MNPAALIAALHGDIANAIIASTPGGIERQEAQGQADLNENQNKLPKDISAEDKAALESIGFVFGEVVDEIFLACTFPEGWSLQPTDHSMWSNLLDPQGRRRAGVFYKAAFYDRNAHMRLVARYRDTCNYERSDCTYYIVDNADGSVKHTVGVCGCSDWTAGDELAKQATEWLNTNLPDWKNPLAYW